MYIVFNRNFEKVREYKKLGDLQLELGDDFEESKVDSLEFIRGSTVIRRNKLDNMVADIVKVEKDSIFEHITSDIERDEDVKVELRTENKVLSEKLEEKENELSNITYGLKEVNEEIKKSLSRLNGEDYVREEKTR